MRLVPVLGLLVGAILACGGDKVPKPWVKHEGRREVKGTPTKLDDPGGGGSEGAGRNDATVLEQPNIRVVEPDVGSDLPPVADSYEALAAVGEITSCPEGTTLVDERREANEEYCALAGGVRHGPFMTFYRNGRVEEVGPYVGGKRHGQVVRWDEQGRKYSTYTWVNGQPVAGEVYK